MTTSPCRIRLAVLLLAAAAALWPSPGIAGRRSVLVDDRGDAGRDAPGFVDIVAASARQVNGPFLQFEMVVAGEIDLDAALDDAHQYFWFLHAGADLNLRVFRDRGGEWRGELDGGPNPHFVEIFLGGRRVVALVHLADLGWPGAVTWNAVPRSPVAERPTRTGARRSGSTAPRRPRRPTGT